MPKHIHEGLPLFSKTIYEDDILEHIDYVVEQQNTILAEAMAAHLRTDSSAYPYGPMWAEARYEREAHTIVCVQASVESFIIHVDSPQDLLVRQTSARWERTDGMLSSISLWGANQDALLWYADPEVDAHMPNTCNRWQASHTFAMLLDRIA